MDKNEIEIPFGSNDSELVESIYHIPDGMEAIIEGDKVIIRKKASKDENIRKELIHLVKKSYEQGGYCLNKYEANEMISWLEKQGEQESAENSGKHSESIIKKEDMTEYNKGFECGKQRVLKYPEDFGLCKNSIWKPTKMQMEVLAHYADQNNCNGFVLTSLLNDLKKL